MSDDRRNRVVLLVQATQLLATVVLGLLAYGINSRLASLQSDAAMRERSQATRDFWKGIVDLTAQARRRSAQFPVATCACAERFSAFISASKRLRKTRGLERERSASMQSCLSAEEMMLDTMRDFDLLRLTHTPLAHSLQIPKWELLLQGAEEMQEWFTHRYGPLDKALAALKSLESKEQYPDRYQVVGDLAYQCGYQSVGDVPPYVRRIEDLIFADSRALREGADPLPAPAKGNRPRHAPDDQP